MPGTKEKAYRMKKGDTLVVPTGVTMRLVATGTEARRAFAVIIYDSSKPPVNAHADRKIVGTQFFGK
jgi:quercetin dioxygenase-like cupin family protein